MEGSSPPVPSSPLVRTRSSSSSEFGSRSSALRGIFRKRAESGDVPSRGLDVRALLLACHAGELVGKPSKVVIEGRSFSGLPLLPTKTLSRYASQFVASDAHVEAGTKELLAALERECFVLSVSSQTVVVLGDAIPLLCRFSEALTYFVHTLVADRYALLTAWSRKAYELADNDMATLVCNALSQPQLLDFLVTFVPHRAATEGAQLYRSDGVDSSILSEVARRKCTSMLAGLGRFLRPVLELPEAFEMDANHQINPMLSAGATANLERVCDGIVGLVTRSDGGFVLPPFLRHFLARAHEAAPGVPPQNLAMVVLVLRILSPAILSPEVRRNARENRAGLSLFSCAPRSALRHRERARVAIAASRVTHGQQGGAANMQRSPV